ncbi:ABC transporter substrate-binding protein [Pelagivirga sediminicola]|nr:ABC transporter substrate-binding protein [Pelagivirga sediminicola]
MKKILMTTAALALVSAPALAAGEITVVRAIDANNYDPHKSTAQANAEIMFMLGDTLVSLAPDMKTIESGIAKEWEVSDDGLTYTFRLHDNVQFCDGKKLTADDVVYSIERWIDPETNSPVAWRAGEVESVTAIDPFTVEYKLKSPFSELLYQLAQSFGTIIDKDTVEALGPDFGVAGFNGTGPFCWVEWTPRDKMIMDKHEAYTWGAPFHKNTGPASLDRITWQIVPEENTRTVAVMTGQSEVSPYIPVIALKQLESAPGVEVVRSDLAPYTYYIGFKIDKETVSDPVVRRAINLAVDQEAMAEDLFFGEVEPAYSYVTQDALDWNHDLDDTLLKYDPEAAKKMLDEAGWVPGDDGVRAKGGVRLSPLIYTFAESTYGKQVEAVQSYLREIGIDLQIESFDATVVWGKLATQEFDMYTMGYPYVSSGDALNLYFRSENIPTPNRMNWNDEKTDELLDAGAAATDDAERAKNYGEVLKMVHDAAAWLPLYHDPMVIVQSTDLETITPHNLYGAGLYKGLDLKFKE